MTAVFLVALFSEFPIIRVAEKDTILAGIAHKYAINFYSYCELVWRTPLAVTPVFRTRCGAGSALIIRYSTQHLSSA